MQFSYLAHGSYDAYQIHRKGLRGNCPKKNKKPQEFKAKTCMTYRVLKMQGKEGVIY